MNVVADVQPRKHHAAAVVSASILIEVSDKLVYNASTPAVIAPFNVTVVNASHKLNAPAFLPPEIATTQSTSSSILSSVDEVLNSDCFSVMPDPPISVTSSPDVLKLVNAVPLVGRSNSEFHAAKSFAGKLPVV